MDEFEKWVEDYALMHEREITKADCEAAFRAGMRAAAELCHSVVVRGDIVTMELTAQRIKDAILAEADK